MDKVKYIVSPRTSYGLLKLSGNNEVEAFEPISSPIDYMWLITEDGEVNTHDGVVDVQEGDLVIRTYIGRDGLAAKNYKASKLSLEEKIVVLRKDNDFVKTVKEYKQWHDGMYSKEQDCNMVNYLDNNSKCEGSSSN